MRSSRRQLSRVSFEWRFCFVWPVFLASSASGIFLLMHRILIFSVIFMPENIYYIVYFDKFFFTLTK